MWTILHISKEDDTETVARIVYLLIQLKRSEVKLLPHPESREWQEQMTSIQDAITRLKRSEDIQVSWVGKGLAIHFQPLAE